MQRTATLARETKETRIDLTLDLDGNGKAEIASGVGFLDHMLTLFAAHAMIDLSVRAKGDLHIDAHHTVEDIGITLGEAFKQALGEKRGIRRYGHATLPMDESLATVAVDFCGRPCFVYRVEFTAPKIGEFDTELVGEFWQGFVGAAGCNLHQILHYGTNGHHIAEALFKATARAVRNAVETDPRQAGIPSTKGKL
ncbi:MAG TPA: imidazoleglycerol-phosphate dehydratase HisB [Planctomycetaceae bacterium]|nr:imidazoleglycerol-phosphate dehydratase HisB [Planctomycetaceae bacterium]